MTDLDRVKHAPDKRSSIVYKRLPSGGRRAVAIEYESARLGLKAREEFESKPTGRKERQAQAQEVKGPAETEEKEE